MKVTCGYAACAVIGLVAGGLIAIALLQPIGRPR